MLPQNPLVECGLVSAHVLEHVGALVRGWPSVSCDKLYVHERLAPFDRDRLTVVAQIHKLESQPSNKPAVNLGGIQKRQPHSSVSTLGG